MAESNGKTARDLRGIQGVRFLSMFGIIMGHVALLFSAMPYRNTDYIEKVRLKIFIFYSFGCGRILNK